MPSEIGSVTSRDGITLRTRAWTPSAPPWAGMLLVHGLGEHSGRYERTGSILAAAGILVHGWDHRGFGASGGTPCHVERWESLLDDVDEALERLRAAVGDRPVVMLGHSMGGLIALDQATSGRPTSDLLVLSAPGLADSLAPWKHRAAPWLDPLLPRLRLPSGIRPQDVSCDPAQAAADAADPLIRQAGTVHLARIGFDAQRRVSARLATLERMPMPTLVIHGSADPVVPVASTEALGRLDGVTRRVLPGLRHESLNEPEGPAIVADLVAWVADRVARRSSPAHAAAATGPRTEAVLVQSSAEPV
jgi:acylglycerol lipase